MVMFGDERLPERFWAKCRVDDSGCWIWTAACSSGYAVIGGGSRWNGSLWTAKAHRWGYERLVAEVPVHLDLDHLCRVRNCVNPAHLEPVSRAENLRRSPLTPHARKFATHCRRGHEFTAENTRVTKRQRTCRACERAWFEQRRAA